MAGLLALYDVFYCHLSLSDGAMQTNWAWPGKQKQTAYLLVVIKVVVGNDKVAGP